MVPLTPHLSPPTTLNLLYGPNLWSTGPASLVRAQPLRYGPNISGTGPTSPIAASAPGTKRFPTATTSVVGAQESLASGPQQDREPASGPQRDSAGLPSVWSAPWRTPGRFTREANGPSALAQPQSILSQLSTLLHHTCVYKRVISEGSHPVSPFLLPDICPTHCLLVSHETETLPKTGTETERKVATDVTWTLTLLAVRVNVCMQRNRSEVK